MSLNEKQRKQFEDASRPLMRFLSNTELFHPHFTAILTSVSAELVEGSVMFRTEDYIATKEESSWGTCGFCHNDGLITKDPEGNMCDRCWDRD